MAHLTALEAELGKVKQVLYFPSLPKEAARWFALTARGNCLEPELMDGDIALIDPESDPKEGDYVLLKARDKAGREGLFIKRYRCTQQQTWFESNLERFDLEVLKILGVVRARLRAGEALKAAGF